MVRNFVKKRTLIFLNIILHILCSINDNNENDQNDQNDEDNNHDEINNHLHNHFYNYNLVFYI